MGVLLHQGSTPSVCCADTSPIGMGEEKVAHYIRMLLIPRMRNSRVLRLATACPWRPAPAVAACRTLRRWTPRIKRGESLMDIAIATPPAHSRTTLKSPLPLGGEGWVRG